MKRSTELFFRFAAAILLATLFGLAANNFAAFAAEPILWGSVLAGGIIGFIVSTYPLKKTLASLEKMPTDRYAGMALGIVLSSIVAALITIPLSSLPSPLGQILPIVIGLPIIYLGTISFSTRPHDVQTLIAYLRPQAEGKAVTEAAASVGLEAAGILLDTSVIIDGRIADISKTGFINTPLVVPNFVLTELQHIADSPDPVRRKRGRRGLDVLEMLRNECPIPFKITDMDASEVREVDSKLVALARHLDMPIMTNDYNLNRVAGLQGVSVLNINDLANAVKATHLPGEDLRIKIIQDGRENSQGVGYLEDGTMVVVEEGKHHMNKQLGVVVTKVLQTSAGRMIFARIA